MRRILLGVGACVALLLSMCRADATVVYGTAGAQPLLAIGQPCSPSAAALAPEGDRTLPFSGRQTPRTPVPGLTPEGGSRYLQYDGNAAYGRGIVANFGPGDLPRAVSLRVAAPSGTAYAIPFAIAYTWGPGDGDGVQEYLGVANQPSWQKIGTGWTTASVDFNNQTAMHWFSWDATHGWLDRGSSWSIGGNVIWYGNRPASWSSRVGFLLGCGQDVPIDADLLSTRSDKAGSQTYDFEGLQSTVTATASAPEVTYGQPVTIMASAKQGSTPAAVPLRLVRCQGATCQYLGDPVTSSPAAPVDFIVHPEPGWTYGVRYDGDATFDPAQSNVAIGVRSKLVVALSQSRAHVGNIVSVGGQIGPCTGSPRRLAIQRLVRGTWRTVGHARASKCAVIGRHQFKPLVGSVRVGTTGRWRLRVVAPAAHGSVMTVSRILRVTVTRAPVRQVVTVHYAPPPVTHTDQTTSAPPPPS